MSVNPPITQDYVNDLEARLSKLQRDLIDARSPAADFGLLSSDYTGSHYVAPYRELTDFYHAQHEMIAIRVSLASSATSLRAAIQPDARGGFYRWPDSTPSGLQARLDELDNVSVDLQIDIQKQTESRERANMLSQGRFQEYLFVHRYEIHALFRFLYVCAFLVGVASIPITILIGLRFGPSTAVKLSVGFLWLSTFALILRLFEAKFLMGGLPQVFRGWQDRVGFWASWVFLVLVHATFYAGLFEKLALRGK